MGLEFQKRGLPHRHILLFLDGPSALKYLEPEHIDRVIRAEIPTQEEDPDGKLRTGNPEGG